MKLPQIITLFFSAQVLAAPAFSGHQATVADVVVSRSIPEGVEIAARDSFTVFVNMLLFMISKVYPVNILVTDLDELSTKNSQAIANAQGFQTTENGLSAKPLVCADLTIIFARGTTEAGNVGSVVGPALFKAVQESIGSKTLLVQGVDYAATVPGFLEGGDPAGATMMAANVETALAACPSTRLVMSGYSQGGQIVHNAAKLLGDSVMAAVSSVVIFGDPMNGTPVTGATDKTDVFCHVGDDICLGGDLILLPHVTYALDAPAAAAFITSKAGL